MRIRWTRCSPDRHRFEIVRADGSREGAELETRSVLLHDFVHYAVESEAGIDDGFYGLLARGLGFGELRREVELQEHPGIHRAESLVGPMQAVWNGRISKERYVEQLGPGDPAVDQVPVDRAFVDRVCERLRQITGQWRGTPFHDTMELVWPAAD